MNTRIYTTREDYAREVWASLDAQTQADILADYDMSYGLMFLMAFTDNMDSRYNGTVTFTRVEGGYTVEDEAGAL